MIKNYKKFFEGKKKFPNLKKIEADGYLIYVGKDSQSNDHLTFNMANDDDIWMHVKGSPGSHVVIKSKGKLPTNEILRYAAELAKQNSKAKGEDKAPVVYCKRRFVKKEKGMNPGQVKVDYVNAYEIVV